MVSFSCEACGDICAKKKLDQHQRQCRGASFTCLDCMRHFHGTEYRSHTSCISEAQKYQGGLYREKGSSKADKRKSMNGHRDSQAMVPRQAYVEDGVEGDDSQAVAVVDVPPRAPTPPTMNELPASVNVFDFLVSEATPGHKTKEIQAAEGAKRIEQHVPGSYPNVDSQYSQYSNGEGTQFMQHGFSYGDAPLAPEFARYDSYNNLLDSQNALMPPPPPYVTPAPKEHRREKSDKKRKRHIEELDLSSSSAAKRPSSRDEMMLDAPRSGGRVLHSGLTGGLSKLVTDRDFYDDRIEAGPTPVSPLKRSKRGDDKDRDGKEKADRRKSSYTSYTTTTSKAPSSSSTRHPEDRHEKSRRHDRSLSPQPARKSHHQEDRVRDHHHRSAPRDSFSSQDTNGKPARKHLKAIDYPEDRSRSHYDKSRSDYDRRRDRPASVQPSASNQMVPSYNSRADLFMSFVTKGPESEKGYSVNKLLKRYHRERNVRGEEEKGEEDKELWRGLRLRRNSRGEIVLLAD